jgi:hypothetical protein
MGMVPIPAEDANDLDDVVRELGIEASEMTPAEAVRELRAELEKCQKANDSLMESYCRRHNDSIEQRERAERAEAALENEAIATRETVTMEEERALARAERAETKVAELEKRLAESSETTPAEAVRELRAELAAKFDEYCRNLTELAQTHLRDIDTKDARIAELEKRLADTDYVWAQSDKAWREAWRARAENAEAWREAWRGRAMRAEAQRDALREVLEWLNRQPTTGFEARDRIRAALAPYAAKRSSRQRSNATYPPPKDGFINDYD